MLGTRGLGAALALSLWVPTAAAEVLVVDVSGGGDHTSLQDAVDAALDGDLLLVKAGTYDGFRVVDKSLSVVAAHGATVTVQGGVVVEDLAAQRQVTLIRLLVTGEHEACPSQGSALLATDNAGAVRLLACELTGSVGTGGTCFPLYCPCPYEPYSYYSAAGGELQYPADFGWDAVRLERCDQVALAGCVLRGGLGLEGVPYYGVGGDGGRGLVGLESDVTLYNCILEGAEGVYGGNTGGDGGHALLLDSDRLFASGTTFLGGDGGYSDDFVFSVGGDGGDGARLAAGAELEHLDCAFAGGAEGESALFYDGVPGEPIAGAGTLTSFSGTARGVVVRSPATDGGSIQLDFHGVPGDVALLAISFDPGYLPDPAHLGVILIGAGSFEVMGFVPASGTLTKVFPLSVLGPAQESVEVYVQSVYLDASLAVLLGSFGHAVIVQPGL